MQDKSSDLLNNFLFLLSQKVPATSKHIYFWGVNDIYDVMKKEVLTFYQTAGDNCDFL